jgi:hypothetical protein
MTFAEMNPEIVKDVAFVAQAATITGLEMNQPDCEGCSILEGLLEIQTAVNRAVERYLSED